ncbi:MAG: hypothetical protein PHQ34_08845 [Methanothrix sp.]|nr:hypothetical protein [Methanothrix sp.]
MSPANPHGLPGAEIARFSHKQLPEAATPHEKTALQRQIEATDGQIDALVYELYGLTEEEIGIVEAVGKKKRSAKVFKRIKSMLKQGD